MKYKDIRQNPSLLIPYRSRELIELTCSACDSVYSRPKHRIQDDLDKVIDNCCSRSCGQFKTKITNDTICKHCQVLFHAKTRSMIFCSHSCAASFNNKSKLHGTRVSKLECWLATQLTSLYPNLEFHFNRKDVIGSELDIYIPSMKLAFELNGIFHYEPIYGEEKLSQIQLNDKNKFQSCIREGISLCIIDTSGQKYFKPSTSQKYLDIIIKIMADGEEIESSEPLGSTV